MNGKVIILVSTLLVMVLALCMGSKALGSEKEEDFRSDYYRNIEKAYVTSVRNSLDDLGYKNAGITMTRVVDNGFADYTITVHHGKIDLLDEAHRNEITDIILMEPIGIDNSSVHVRYLEYM